MKRGDILFVISAERSTAHGDTQATVTAQLQARRENLREELDKQRSLERTETAALMKRIDDLRGELAQIGSELETQKKRLALAQEGLARFKKLEQEKFVSAIQVQQKSEEVLDQQARSQSLERNRLALQREIASVKFELDSAPLKARQQQAIIERNIFGVEQDLAENEARRQVLVTAPQDGILTSITTEPGQTVGSQTLAAIVPTGSVMEAHLYAPSRAAGFIKPGEKVLLRYEAFPYQKFGQYEGVVAAVSRSAF